MALKLTCPGDAAPVPAKPKARLRWLRAGFLCLLLVGIAACSRAEPQTTAQQVAKTDGDQPQSAPAPKAPTDQPQPHPKQPTENPGRVSPTHQGTEVPPPKKEPVKKAEPDVGITVKSIKTLGPLAYGVSALAFSADDTTLAATGWSGPTINTPWQPATADKTTLAAGHWTGEVKLWTVADSKAVADLKILARPRSVAFGPDPKTLVIACDGAGIAQTIPGPAGPARGLFNEDFRACNYLTTSEVVVWNFDSNKVVKTLKDNTMGWAPRLSPDGKTLAIIPRHPQPSGRTNFQMSAIHLWDVGTGERFEVLEGHKGLPFYPAFSSDSKRVASSSLDGTVRVWHLGTGKSPLTLNVDADAVAAAQSSGSGGGHVADNDLPVPYTMVAFSPDSKTLAVGFVPTAGLAGKDKVVKLYGLPDGTATATIPSHGSIAYTINCLAFSPDAKVLVVGTSWESKLWDVASGKAIATIADHGMLGMAFSHDGTLLAVGTPDGKVTLWEITRQQGSAKLEKP